MPGAPAALSRDPPSDAGGLWASAESLDADSVRVVACPDWLTPTTLFVGWPYRGDVWREGAEPARRAMERFVRLLAQYVSVTVLADGRRGAHEAARKAFSRDLASDSSTICVRRVDMDDCWVRDTGPVFVSSTTGARLDGEDRGNERYGLVRHGFLGGRGDSSPLAASCSSSETVQAVSFEFNAWGGESKGACYSVYEMDRIVGQRIAGLSGVPCWGPEIVLEGGSISTDGRGTLITTEECLLHENRNPHMSRCALERALKHTVGARKIVWLPHGVAGDDDTNGHVDNMCVFIAQGHVILHWAEAEYDEEQHERSRSALDVLHASTDADGGRFVVHKIHAPRVPLCRTDSEAEGVHTPRDETNCDALESSLGSAKPRPVGERLAASYVNLVFAGEAVVVPAFEASKEDDARAIREIRAAMSAARAPQYPLKVFSVPAREFVLAGGGLHCLTVALPACGTEKL